MSWGEKCQCVYCCCLTIHGGYEQRNTKHTHTLSKTWTLCVALPQEMAGMWRDHVTSLGGPHAHPAFQPQMCWGLHTSFHISKWHTNMHIPHTYTVCQVCQITHTDTLCTVTHDLSHSLTTIKVQHCQGHNLDPDSGVGGGGGQWLHTDAVLTHWKCQVTQSWPKSSTSCCPTASPPGYASGHIIA